MWYGTLKYTSVQWIYIRTMNIHPYIEYTTVQWIYIHTMNMHPYSDYASVQWIYIRTMTIHPYNEYTSVHSGSQLSWACDKTLDNRSLGMGFAPTCNVWFWKANLAELICTYICDQKHHNFHVGYSGTFWIPHAIEISTQLSQCNPQVKAINKSIFI